MSLQRHLSELLVNPIRIEVNSIGENEVRSLSIFSLRVSNGDDAIIGYIGVVPVKRVKQIPHGNFRFVMKD